MHDANRLAQLQRSLDHVGIDEEISHEIYHDDAVFEFPQSRERFEGKANMVPWRSIYPAVIEFRTERIRGEGMLWVAEIAIRYDGGPWHYGCSIMEFRGDKIARETIYIGETWDAPDWRASWRAEWQQYAFSQEQ